MKFFVIQRSFDTLKANKQFKFHTIIAKNKSTAKEIMEESISSNMSQDWLLTREETEALKMALAKPRTKLVEVLAEAYREVENISNIAEEVNWRDTIDDIRDNLELSKKEENLLDKICRDMGV